MKHAWIFIGVIVLAVFFGAVFKQMAINDIKREERLEQERLERLERQREEAEYQLRFEADKHTVVYNVTKLYSEQYEVSELQLAFPGLLDGSPLGIGIGGGGIGIRVGEQFVLVTETKTRYKIKFGPYTKTIGKQRYDSYSVGDTIECLISLDKLLEWK